MASLKEMLERFQKGPSDVLGLDIQTSGIAAVRMRKGNEGISVVAADMLPAITLPDLDAEEPEAPEPLAIPSKLKSRYAAITTGGTSSIIKLLSFPGAFNEATEAKVVDNLGIEDPDAFRVGYKLAVEGHGKSESRVIAVAMPENLAATLVALLPAGLPAPYALEVSGLATMTAFVHGPGATHDADAVGAIDFGEEATTFSLFNKGSVALVRTFSAGTSDVLNKVQEGLGVDRETAQGIIADGAFDISASVNEVMEPLVKQLIVSRDFVERRENCHVNKLYVSGGLTVSRDSLNEMTTAMGVEIDFWNPFEGLTMGTHALPEKLVGHEWRFSAAVGSVLGTFEET